MTAPRAATAFVSYSWDGDEHESWVRRFATDLRARGIDAMLDQWDLPVGASITAFMERIARVDHALLICTEPYAAKANDRAGGVGWEYGVLAGAAFVDGATIDIIPVLRSGAPSKALPFFLRDRLFVDLRDDARYAAGLEQVCRHIQRPQELRPPLGPMPAAGPTAPLNIFGRAPGARVLVAGTGRERAFTEAQRATAERLGALLARLGCGLVTGGWPGVDEAVARAFTDAVQQAGLPLEDCLVQVVREGAIPAFAAGDLVIVHRRAAEWTQAIERCDAIVLIGGLGGTLTTGKMGLEAGKLVLPLADTGGDAMELYMHLLGTRGDWPFASISRKQFQTLSRPAPSVVDQLPALLGARC